MNFYNEHDPNAAAWLRELIARALIPHGVVDERSITDIQPHELHGYTQCHFFAGIGGWSLALRLAGWPDTEPVWTGSCPCQPFSVAGKGLGDKDERHLWPVFSNLIAECRPQCVFGEQVASAIGKGWLDGVSADLETNGYACGSAVLGAHSVSAPHQRQRLFWVAVSDCNGSAPGLSGSQHRQEGFAGITHDRSGEVLCLADPTSGGLGIVGDAAFAGSSGHTHGSIDAGGMGNAAQHGCEVRRNLHRQHDGQGLGKGCEPCRLGIPDSDRRTARDEPATTARHGDSVEPASFWSESRIIHCRDGKFRRIPVEPALFPLADGLPYKLARRGSIRPALLKGAGNAIVPQVAAEFIMAFRHSIALDKYPQRV